MNFAEAEAELRNSGETLTSGFDILQTASRLLAGSEEDRAAGRALLIRALERAEDFNGERPVLNALVRESGLFPYLDPEMMSVSDLIAYEAHRPVGLDDSIVFHEVQGHVYRRLIDGENVILSAPTSFGKSLILDALLTSGKYRNVVVIVPTIALIDETRRRLTRLRSGHKIVTHASQQFADRNVLVLTQERLLDLRQLPPIDLFVIDEFYKLDDRVDPHRSELLNHALYRLWKTGAQFYLLGPNVAGLANGLPGPFEYAFVRTNVQTVVVDVISVDASTSEVEALTSLVSRLNEPTIIYCRSPARTREVARWLLETDRAPSPQLSEASDWISQTYHPDWLVGRALARGIGIHHGRVPRAIAQYLVRAFNSGLLNVLICTSTLIEGVNTQAKNVIIFDNQVNTRRLDFFTFNNIRGRSGRMFAHFSGRVYLFHQAPGAEDTTVDVPILTQADDVSDSMLVQVEPDDLTDTARDRVNEIEAEATLSMETIRSNVGIDPGSLEQLAAELRRRPQHYSELLSWTGPPRYEQIAAVCDLMWNYLIPRSIRSRVPGTRTHPQLAYQINQLRFGASVREQIESQMASPFGGEGDDAVEEVLSFHRQWAGHYFPRYLMVLDSVQRDVFLSINRPPGNYSFFAAQVEHMFFPGQLTTLDEYGIPLPLSAKLQRWLNTSEGLDELLLSVRALPPAVLARLHPFEISLVEDTRNNI